MRRSIETAPMDGSGIIVEDDAKGSYDVVHWSAEAAGWVSENGEPIKITPSYWYPLQTANNPQYSDGLSDNPSEAGPPRARRSRRRLTISSIAATLAVAALAGAYFRDEVSASVTRYGDMEEISRIRTIGGHYVGQAVQWLTDGPVKAYQQEFQQPAEAAQAGVQEIVAVKQSLATPEAEARPFSENEPRREALAKELPEASRTVDRPNLELQADATTAAQSLVQEREKTAGLVQAADAARQALAAGTAQHLQALEQERARSEALAGELALVRRDLDTKVTLLSRADDAAAQLKQDTEATTAELLRSLQQERDRGAAFASELATVRRDFETKTALLGKMGDEAVQLRQAAADKTAELQQERQRASALVRELAAARDELDTKAALSNRVGDEAALLRQAAEAKTAELRQSLRKEQQRAAALARDLQSAQRAIEARVTSDQPAKSQIDPIKQDGEPSAATAARANPEATRLMARAKALLAQGYIGAARTVLERAAETGSAEADFALAETYDPHILSSWGTYGTRGDAAKAREFYAKARVGGIPEAENRFNALRR
jgi:hypothetical protein